VGSRYAGHPCGGAGRQGRASGVGCGADEFALNAAATVTRLRRGPVPARMAAEQLQWGERREGVPAARAARSLGIPFQYWILKFPRRRPAGPWPNLKLTEVRLA
jgi:hypothetical protein